MKLVAVVLSRNEQENLDRCIKSLDWCGEVIVIDDYSTDDTVKKAVELGAKVYRHPLNNDFAQQRNFALKKTTAEWVLFVDADEIVTPELCTEIKKAIHNKHYSGYMLKRRDIWMGKELKYGEFGDICLLRLGRRTAGSWQRSVHEHWLIDGEVGQLKQHLLHYPHPTLYEFLKQIGRYSILHGRENQIENKKSSVIKIVFYPVAKFIKNFIIKKGYRDGLHGFVAAVFMSFHSFLSWSSLWYLQKNIGSKSN